MPSVRLRLAAQPEVRDVAAIHYLVAAARLGAAPERAVVVEDALPGVAAGHAGGFGLVVGVAHPGTLPENLFAAGADVVVEDLAELVPWPPDPMPPR